MGECKCDKDKIGKLAISSMNKIIKIFESRGLALSEDTFHQLHDVVRDYSERKKSLKRRV